MAHTNLYHPTLTVLLQSSLGQASILGRAALMTELPSLAVAVARSRICHRPRDMLHSIMETCISHCQGTPEVSQDSLPVHGLIETSAWNHQEYQALS